MRCACVPLGQAQPWIYRYRAELLETIGDVEMTEDVCIAPLTPSRGPDYDERLYAPCPRCTSSSARASSLSPSRRPPA